MEQHGTRYGLAVADKEFMEIKQVDQSNNLDISQAIPYFLVLAISPAMRYLGI